MTFGQTFRLRLETTLISSNCVWNLCNTTPGTWKITFSHRLALILLL